MHVPTHFIPLVALLLFTIPLSMSSPISTPTPSQLGGISIPPERFENITNFTLAYTEPPGAKPLRRLPIVLRLRTKPARDGIIYDVVYADPGAREDTWTIYTRGKAEITPENLGYSVGGLSENLRLLIYTISQSEAKHFSISLDSPPPSPDPRLIITGCSTKEGMCDVLDAQLQGGLTQASVTGKERWTVYTKKRAVLIAEINARQIVTVTDETLALIQACINITGDITAPEISDQVLAKFQPGPHIVCPATVLSRKDGKARTIERVPK